MARTRSDPPGGLRRAAEALAGGEAQPKGTPTALPTVPCPPNCRRACIVPQAWWHDLGTGEPDPWRICYALVGFGPGRPPIPREGYRDALRWFAEQWGAAAVARGLRYAADTPVPHPYTPLVDRARLAVLADVWADYAEVAP